MMESNRIIIGPFRRPESSSHLIHPNIEFREDEESGYVPLIHLVNSKFGEHEKFKGVSVLNSYFKGASYLLNYSRGRASVNFKPNLTSRRGSDQRTIHFCMLTAIGTRRINYILTKEIYLYSNGSSEGIVAVPMEVFILPVVKKEDVEKIEINSSYQTTVSFDPSDIVFLVSREKFHRISYMSTFYNRTIREILRKNILEIIEKGAEKRVVSEEEMRKYYYNPFSLNTNSFMDAMIADQRIKEKIKVKLGGKFALMNNE